MPSYSTLHDLVFTKLVYAYITVFFVHALTLNIKVPYILDLCFFFKFNETLVLKTKTH